MEHAAPAPAARLHESNRLLQHCGGRTCPASTRDHDDERWRLSHPHDSDEQEADRVADTALGRTEAPPNVNRALAGAGRPLDQGSRALWESLFAFDFASVRVHADGDADESARAIGARAYAAGPHVVFARGAYAPDTRGGQSLIGHELAHVVQQRGAQVVPDGRLALGERHDLAERQAHDSVERAARGQAPMNPSAAPVAVVRRQPDLIDVELHPSSPEEQAEADRLGIRLPKVSPGTWRVIGGRADNAGATLIPAEEQKIDNILKAAKVAAAAPGNVVGARFLLHDTAAPVGSKKIADEASQGRGPLGAGVAAWVPRAGAATITRPNFYETRRPSTSEFEKGADIITRPVREQRMREVWAATNAAEQTAAITRALDGLGLTPAETASETTTIKGRLGGTGMVMTSAAWTVGEICSRVTSAGAAAVATPGREAALTTACTALAAYFRARPGRVGTLVPVEIVQESGLANPKGDQNSCNPNNSNLVPLPKPAYTAAQYSSLVVLYLRAARAAGRFPEVTTHFVVDAFEKGHCDPRCFDLQHLYDRIAAALGHGRGSTYGPAPSYGTTWGTNNVWWNDRICGGPHP